MTSTRKAGKALEPKNPSGIRLDKQQKKIARQAARLESLSRGRKIGWTTLVGDKGIEWCARRVRRAVKESAA